MRTLFNSRLNQDHAQGQLTLPFQPTPATVSARLCGSTRVPEEVVRSIKAPPFTDTWHPVSHDRIITLLESTLKENGLSIAQKDFQLSHDNNRMFGTYLLNGDTQKPDYGFAIGLRNSTDKAFPAGFAFGSKVFVCSNLCFSGDIVIARRHTSGIMHELPEMMKNAIKNFTPKMEEISNQYEQWKCYRIGDATIHKFLWNLGYDNVLPFAFLKQEVYPLWDKPKHDSHLYHGERTVWTLHNAFSEAMKSRQEKNPFEAAKETQEISERMKVEFPIAA